jgi:hypothetical protein
MRNSTARRIGWRIRALACLVLAGLLFASAAAQGATADKPIEKRIALVIGNARYPAIPLNNPENDARVVGRTLRGLGFEVDEQVNLPVKKFRQVVRAYVRRLQQEDAVGLLYYAGHGVQIDGKNYLLPVDINLRDEEEIKDEAVDIDDLFVSKLDRAKARALIVILDACRDNPFRGKTRNIAASGGLAEMGARGALIAYSAAPGATAEDGPEGTNSVFTRHLVREMLEPGVEVETMFKNVRIKVLQETNKRQMPWVNTSLTIPFAFNPQRVPSREEVAKQGEIEKLRDRLERLEREQREREDKLRAMQQQLDLAKQQATAPPPPVPAAETPAPRQEPPPRTVEPAPAATVVLRPGASEVRRIDNQIAMAWVEASRRRDEGNDSTPKVEAPATPAAPTAPTASVPAPIPPPAMVPASTAPPSGTPASNAPNAIAPATKAPPAEKAATSAGAAPDTSASRENAVRRESPSRRETRAQAGEPKEALASGAKKGSTQLARNEATGVRRESERCVALQIRAQLGEPVSSDELRRECRK